MPSPRRPRGPSSGPCTTLFKNRCAVGLFDQQPKSRPLNPNAFHADIVGNDVNSRIERVEATTAAIHGQSDERRAIPFDLYRRPLARRTNHRLARTPNLDPFVERQRPGVRPWFETKRHPFLGAVDGRLQVRPRSDRHTITRLRRRRKRRLSREWRRLLRRTCRKRDEPERAPARTAGSVQPAADARGASDQLGSTKR